jgi:hypothetical protein
MSVRAGIALGAARLREPGAASAGVLALAFVAGVALLERAQGAVGAADRALSGGAFGLALPLLCYFLVARVCASGNLREAVWPLSRHGVDGRALAIGLAVPPALAAAAFAAISAIAVVLITRGLHDPAWLGDTITSLWIGVASAFAYVVALVGASAIGQRGQGRIWLLAADFLLGAGSSLLALPWPKGHVRNLLGGVPVLEMSQLAAIVVMLGTSFAFLWLGALRSQR